MIDLFCGLGGWAGGFLAEGFECIGFDIERHDYGTGGYPAQLVLQDVLTLHGSQFRNAAVIVASPPCQQYSYMAMPWARAKRIAAEMRNGDCPSCDGTGNFYGHDQDGDYLPCDDCRGTGTSDGKLQQLNSLFDACFRIQREACEATTICLRCNGTGQIPQMIDDVINSQNMKGCPQCRDGRIAGRHIPLVVENVKGAQPWVGRAAWHYGSYYLWGDVPALMPWTAHRKVPGMNFHEHEKTGQPGRSFQSAAVDHMNGVKQHGSGAAWFDEALDERRRQGTGTGPAYGGSFGWDGSQMRKGNSHNNSRKAASAQIAKIPFALAQHIAQVFKPCPAR